MTAESLLSEQETAKPGPKTTIKDVEERAKTLEERVEALEGLISYMAHMSGVSHDKLLELDITPYVLRPKDQNKYAKK